MPHQLEIAILNAANATPINTDMIAASLAQMERQEIYLTIRSEMGETIGDVIFHRVGLPMLREPLAAHNKKIDESKRQRLAQFLEVIKTNTLELLQDREDEFRACQPQDLTFLLTEALRFQTSLAILEFIITVGADCNVFGTDGRLPAHLAIEKGNDGAVVLLQVRGADFSLGDTKHRNLLDNALYHNRYKLLGELIRRYHCDPNVLDYSGNGLLHKAVSHGDREQANLLLQLGVDPTIPNIYGETPLDMAVGGTRGFDILNSMFLADYPPNQPNKQDIRASRQRIANDLRTAIAEKVRIDRILEAVFHVHDGVLHLASLDISDTDIPKLIRALQQVSFLHTLNLSNNRNLTEAGIEALLLHLVGNSWVVNLNLTRCQVSAQKIEEYRQILRPDSRLKKLLMNYNQEEHLDVVTMLIENKADFSSQEEDGWYLWHCAAYYGHAAIANV